MVGAPQAPVRAVIAATIGVGAPDLGERPVRIGAAGAPLRPPVAAPLERYATRPRLGTARARAGIQAPLVMAPIAGMPAGLVREAAILLHARLVLAHGLSCVALASLIDRAALCKTALEHVLAHAELLGRRLLAGSHAPAEMALALVGPAPAAEAASGLAIGFGLNDGGSRIVLAFGAPCPAACRAALLDRVGADLGFGVRLARAGPEAPAIMGEIIVAPAPSAIAATLGAVLILAQNRLLGIVGAERLLGPTACR